MVSIRLTRTGAKKKPTYRVIATDKRRPRDSRSLEILGHYDPRPSPIHVDLKRERIEYWLSVGARPSDTVQRLIKFFDENGPSLPEAQRKRMQEEAAAKPPRPRPEKEEPKEEAKADEKAEDKPAEEQAKDEKADDQPAAAAAEGEAAEKPATEESASDDESKTEAAEEPAAEDKPKSE